MKKPVNRVVDLYSGAGGLSLGLEQPERLNGLGKLGYENLGFPTEAFRTILAVEKQEQAAETFRKNFDAEVIEDDIRNVDSFSEWDKADVVVGGLPCQGFSNLNSVKTANLEDERNKLWREFMKAVEEISPDVFLIENVGRFLSTIECANAVRTAEDLGYTTVVDKIWSHEYGVPQKRQRSFIVGSRLGVPFLPKPTREPVKTVADAIGDLPADPDGENWHTGRDVTERTKKRMEAVPPGGNRFDIPRHLLPECWKEYDGGGTDLYGRLWWEKPSVTIRTEFVKPEKGRYLHPKKNRSITIREGARLQTIPDDFEFGSPYKKYVTPLVGNAVPPKLAYHIGVAILAHLEKIDGEIDGEYETENGRLKQSTKIEWDKLESFTTESTSQLSASD